MLRRKKQEEEEAAGRKAREELKKKIANTSAGKYEEELNRRRAEISFKMGGNDPSDIKNTLETENTVKATREVDSGDVAERKESERIARQKAEAGLAPGNEGTKNSWNLHMPPLFCPGLNYKLQMIINDLQNPIRIARLS